MARAALGLGFIGSCIPVVAGCVRELPRDTLRAPDANGVMLPPGFASRIIARTGEKSSKSDYLWHAAPDGGTVFPANDGGWIYVSNSEVREAGRGGVGALRFSASGAVVDSYPVLEGTMSNCSGGPAPWGAWLSCEEHPRGRVWETDPFGKKQAVVHPLMGVFSHEAAAVDLTTGIVYLTEDTATPDTDGADRPDGLFYRFIPAVPGDLSAGRLEGAVVRPDGAVSWAEVPDPFYSGRTTLRDQLPQAMRFKGGEGCVVKDGSVYFSTKGDNVIWRYNVQKQHLAKHYDFARSDNPILSGVDNLAVTPSGEIAVAEDGGNMELVVLDARGTPSPLLRIVGQDQSEITGPAFSPGGDRLYFSSQRGVSGEAGGSGGLTYEITGPFRLWKG